MKAIRKQGSRVIILLIWSLTYISCNTTKVFNSNGTNHLKSETGKIEFLGNKNPKSGDIIKGVVLYKDGTPLQQAFISEINKSGKKKSLFLSDKDGTFSLTIDNSKNRLLVTYVGCYNILTPIESDSIKFIMEDIALEYAPEFIISKKK